MYMHVDTFVLSHSLILCVTIMCAAFSLTHFTLFCYNPSAFPYCQMHA
jgi:hypothetical protein